MPLKSTIFGMLPDGSPVHMHTLDNGRGMSCSICEYGGMICSITVPDARGNDVDVALGYDTLDGCLADSCFMGSLVGRTANRVKRAETVIGGQRFKLDRNDGNNHLHGGAKGFHALLWKGEACETANGQGLKLSLTSPHLDQGYPGECRAEVIHSLGPDNSLALEFRASTDRPTLADLTSHTYFNLSGHDSGPCVDHVARFAARSVLETDRELIPTGRILDTAGTALDLGQDTVLARALDRKDPLMDAAGGFDHFYVLPELPSEPVWAARLAAPATGIAMDVLTNCAGFQFYSGNFMTGGMQGKQGAEYGFRHGFCLEPHTHPDAGNNPEFPSTLLGPGDLYRRTTIYRFSRA